MVPVGQAMGATEHPQQFLRPKQQNKTKSEEKMQEIKLIDLNK